MQMLAQLIAKPSMSSVSPDYDTSNIEVIHLLADWLYHLDFDVEVMHLKSQPHKANLIATLGSGPGGLVLSGHTDTVPYDDGRWNFDPFRVKEQSNKLYGLGSADMKSFFALAIEAAKSFSAGQFQQPLIILATADEESSMDGAKELVQLGRPKARYAVVGEPTNMVPIMAHKGIIMEGIRLKGRSGHSSDPSLGNNAMEGMHRVIGELMTWREELKQQYNNPLFKVPHPTLNLGHIHGGDNPNRICGECELHIDLRTLPGMDLDEMRGLLEQRVGHVLNGSGLELEVHRLIDGTPAFHTPPDSEIVRAVEKLTGNSAEAVAFCTEGPYLNSLGMETIIMGAGDIDQAHQPDEFISTAQLQPMVDVLRQLIQQLCITPQAA
jgi:acetylornithine deacetylase